MAKSYDRDKIQNSINDDMIKEALKAGLSSIKASDNLVNNTLAKCQSEIKNEKQKRSSKLFMPWIYKLGVPLAAGALILILLINDNGMLYNEKSSDMMLQAPSMEMSSNETVMDSYAVPKDKNDDVDADGFAIAPTSASEAMNRDPGLKVQYGAALAGINPFSESENGGIIVALNSSVNRTSNNTAGTAEQSVEVFKSITELYNTTNNTRFELKEDGITRIHTLIPEGVDAQMLINTNSYDEILIGDGYWVLPLKNDTGAIEEILTVNTIDANNPNIAISNRDTIFVVDKVSYIVSTLENSRYIGTELVELFNPNSLNGILHASGYGNNSKFIIADINRGLDFIALTEANKDEIVIPLLTSEALLGLTNKKIYNWDEFKKIVSTVIDQ